MTTRGSNHVNFSGSETSVVCPNTVDPEEVAAYGMSAYKVSS
jgi:hypothetical protein